MRARMAPLKTKHHHPQHLPRARAALAAVMCVLAVFPAAAARGDEPEINPAPAAVDVAAAGAEVAAAGNGARASISSRSRADRLPLGLSERGSEAAADGEPARKDARAAGGKPRGGVAQIVGALGLVVALILLVFKGIRHGARAKGGLAGAVGAGGRSPAGVLFVLGRYPIARGQTLVLLKLDRRVLLVAQTAGGRGAAKLNTLTEITDPDEVASLTTKCADRGVRPDPFSAELERYEKDHEIDAEADESVEPAGHPEPVITAHANRAVRSMRDRLAAWRQAGGQSL